MVCASNNQVLPLADQLVVLGDEGGEMVCAGAPAELNAWVAEALTDLDAGPRDTSPESMAAVLRNILPSVADTESEDNQEEDTMSLLRPAEDGVELTLLEGSLPTLLERQQRVRERYDRHLAEQAQVVDSSTAEPDAPVTSRVPFDVIYTAEERLAGRRRRRSTGRIPIAAFKRATNASPLKQMWVHYSAILEVSAWAAPLLFRL